MVEARNINPWTNQPNHLCHSSEVVERQAQIQEVEMSVLAQEAVTRSLKLAKKPIQGIWNRRFGQKHNSLNARSKWHKMSFPRHLGCISSVWFIYSFCLYILLESQWKYIWLSLFKRGKRGFRQLASVSKERNSLAFSLGTATCYVYLTAYFC